MIKSKADKNVTLIAADTSVDGHLRFAGEIYVNGSVNGDIEAGNESQGTLVISAEGMVKGEIRVPSVVIGGTVEGDVHAGVRLEVASTARVRGDIHYKLVEVQNGAVIDGRMVPEEQTAPNVHALPVGARDDDGSMG